MYVVYYNIMNIMYAIHFVIVLKLSNCHNAFPAYIHIPLIVHSNTGNSHQLPWHLHYSKIQTLNVTWYFVIDISFQCFFFPLQQTSMKPWLPHCHTMSQALLFHCDIMALYYFSEHKIKAQLLLHTQLYADTSDYCSMYAHNKI